ncbi:hypothetical protein F0562_021740 [Nyssa sinensis]|uniref:Homeobox domain-containing protein n=1 Tax=Nyssa sinensis TaxID=561372 RepID=A0A5J5BLU7_9ASTE|nr:hypothetical protein F0562_021740 [Nyssa sinensis]
MELNNFRAESHVAQQSRRDKLRVQQNLTNPSQHFEDYPSNLGQLSVSQGLNPDLIQVRNVRYGNIAYNPAVFTSEMLNFATNSQALLAHNKDAMMMHQESADAAQPDSAMAAGDASFANAPHPIASNFNPSSNKASGDPQNCSVWKSIGSQQSCDWIINYSSGASGVESNQNPMFVGEGLSGSLKVNNISASTLYMKPSYNGYQDVQSSLTNPSSEISSQNSHRHYEEVHLNSPTLYQNTLQEVVTSATTSTKELEMASLVQQNIRDAGRGSWEDGGNELLLLPSYGNGQSNLVGLNNAFARPVEGCHQWNGELGFLANKSERDLRTVMSDSNTQGLALSLSSVPLSKTHVTQLGEKCDSQSRAGVFNGLQPDSKNLKSGYLCSNSEPSIGTKVFENTCQGTVGSSTFAHRTTGPLGPFTGYATILKNSKFLKPAQQLIDEFCSVMGPKSTNTCEVSNKISQEVRASADAANAAEFRAKGGDSGVSSSTFYSSNEISGEAVVAGSSSIESYRPEYQQKKARLMYMHEEVCRRFKQYHEQMQMVVSSFESVAGLTAATPYISLALRTVSSQFRCLKNAISDQLRHTRKALGEDLSSPTAGTSSNKADPSTARLKLIEHSFQKHKSGGGNLGFFEPQQHIWRPQRGLPERSVAVLRAWLFEHFLHPYPTDTDKHMLATQTGLTRNQVSNWFINARVRVWKPMVEEIHSLETKGLTESNSNQGRSDGKSGTVGANRPNDNQLTDRLSINAMLNKQVECSENGSIAGTGDGQSADQWNQEKRSRLECQIPASVDGSLMGFVPYHRSGLGAVSLTLGLRQSAESAQQQLQHQEHQLRRHFGGQMIPDFVG